MGFPPFLFTAIRQVVAGLLLLGAMVLWQGLKLSGQYLVRQLVAGFLLITLGNGLVAWAEVYVPSGVAAVLCATLPAVVIAINMVIYRVRPTDVVIAGIVLGLAGMVVMFSEHLTDLGRTEYRLGIGCTLLAVLSWAAGSVWLKHTAQDDHPFVNAAWQMLFGGLICFLFSGFLGEFPVAVWKTETTFALLYLIFFGSLLAYACYLFALRNLPIDLVSTYAYVNPVVAVVLGWLVLDEKLNAKIWLGVGLVLAGIFLVNGSYRVFKRRV
jgi:drug/metabolite transporter (DMT)-like permease